MARDGLRGGGEEAPRRRLAVLKWLGLACSLLLVGAGLYLLVIDDPSGGEPVIVAKISTGNHESSRDEAALRSRVDRDDAADPLPRGQAVGEADIVIRDPMAQGAVVSYDGDAMLEPGPHGPLPRVGPEGQTPASAYAAPPPTGMGSAPRVALLIGGMGLSTLTTEKAISSLPAGVTLAFAPYGRDVERLAGMARAEGHEIMLQVPMEPYDFPDNDPGPQTLLTGLDVEQNRDRLYWSMSRFRGYVGVTNYMGARFTAIDVGMRPFLEELRGRGLIYVEDGSSQRSLAGQIARDIDLPHETADIILDVTPREADIERALKELEALAAQNGTAIGVATGMPVTIEAIAAWAQGLGERGLVLVPVTAAVAGTTS